MNHILYPFWYYRRIIASLTFVRFTIEKIEIVSINKDIGIPNIMKVIFQFTKFLKPLYNNL
jgi:hypothetical protein